MRTIRYDSAAEFLDANEAHLLSREPEVSLLFGVALRVSTGHAYGDEAPFFATVHQADELRAIAVRTPPHSLILDLPTGDLDAMACLIDALEPIAPDLSGVHAGNEHAVAFAERWAARTGCSSDVVRSMRSYVLRDVTPPRPCPGCFRAASSTEQPLLADWAQRFVDEAIPGDPHQDPIVMVGRMIESGALHVWDDNGPVSMAATTRPMPSGISVGLVYTPIDRRGQGYVLACVAKLSQKMLDQGKAYCTLYTDLSNPVSNAIYQRIGYRPLADFLDIRFLSDR